MQENFAGNSLLTAQETCSENIQNASALCVKEGSKLEKSGCIWCFKNTGSQSGDDLTLEDASCVEKLFEAELESLETPVVDCKNLENNATSEETFKVHIGSDSTKTKTPWSSSNKESASDDGSFATLLMMT
jgi:hypothetical protein